MKYRCTSATAPGSTPGSVLRPSTLGTNSAYPCEVKKSSRINAPTCTASRCTKLCMKPFLGTSFVALRPKLSGHLSATGHSNDGALAILRARRDASLVSSAFARPGGKKPFAGTGRDWSREARATRRRASALLEPASRVRAEKNTGRDSSALSSCVDVFRRKLRVDGRVGYHSRCFVGRRRRRRRRARASRASSNVAAENAGENRSCRSSYLASFARGDVVRAARRLVATTAGVSELDLAGGRGASTGGVRRARRTRLLHVPKTSASVAPRTSTASPKVLRNAASTAGTRATVGIRDNLPRAITRRASPARARRVLA